MLIETDEPVISDKMKRKGKTDWAELLIEQLGRFNIGTNSPMYFENSWQPVVPENYSIHNKMS